MTIITNIMCGLGNQMFQYAAGRALALRNGVFLQRDSSWFENQETGTPSRRYMLDAFSLDLPVATAAETDRLKWRSLPWPLKAACKVFRRSSAYADTFVREPHYAYWPGFRDIGPAAYLEGYWQHEQYFEDIRETIRADFSFPPLPAGAQDVAAMIRRAPASVSVHIRRGDYESNPHIKQTHGLCPPEYYRAALAKVAAAANTSLALFIFSDDPRWAQEYFDRNGHPALVVNFPAHAGKPWHDMHLMSLCAHHVVANSSFSWWAAWLSGERGTVCAPARWFTESRRGDSPVPERWTRL
ncbi:MAG: alpha-1,2-fucosyltransferase [Desulfarculales bacterium]|jgi:hypothetical protein|nr:alpha-1,2-fucosyltransferase [Desulfarculales bacterium]